MSDKQVYVGDPSLKVEPILGVVTFIPVYLKLQDSFVVWVF